MPERNIHDCVLEYIKTGTGGDELYERIARTVYASPRNCGFQDEDEASEALFRFRARILALVRRFEDRGIRFEAFLVASLRFFARTVRREKRLAAEREAVCERAVSYTRELYPHSSAFSPDSEDFAVETPEFPFQSRQIPAFTLPLQPARPVRRSRRRPRNSTRCPEALTGGMTEPLPGREGSRERLSFGRRLVYLFLKCAWDSGDEEAVKVAFAAGLPVAWVQAALAQARRWLEDERCRFEYLSSRRDHSWARLRLLETRLAAELEPLKQESLRRSIQRERERLLRAREVLACFRPLVPNSVIARIVGVPKGTVDSGIYYLKKHLGRSRAR